MKPFTAPFLAPLACALLSLIFIPGSGIGGSERAPFPSLYSNADVFTASIRAAQDMPVSHRRVSGLTVPHHLLAADLIARAFRLAGDNHYEKIVILSPDHFKRTRRAFATTRRSFETVFGKVETSEKDVAQILNDASIIEESDLFADEHGVGALLPFVKHFFPDTPIVPIAVSLGSTRDDWERLIADLKPVITEKTLILQSTDFSHYLPQHEAIQRDQEVLNILAADDVDAVAKLRQPAHLDSRGSQYIQMRLQEEHFHTRPLVIANSNSQSYADEAASRTTSYIVQIYSSQNAAAGVDPPDPSAGTTYCFAGDTFLGRHVRALLSHPELAARLRDALQAQLAGCKLVLNLEGVIVEVMPDKLGPLSLAMPKATTLDWLKALNVVAVSVANNHAKDLGQDALDRMVADIQATGIKVLRDGEVKDLGAFRVVALTDLDSDSVPHSDRIGEKILREVGRSDALPPLVAFVHWGTEYQAFPDKRQLALADALRRAGISLIVGAHPHRADTEIQVLAGGQTAVAYSLGNFLFDQRSDRSSGAILEVRFFPQGTFFARLVTIPNFYDVAHQSD
ncbi:MAG: AmmeMemoRadiSam system protein B [Actinomycetota bacterium]